MQHVHFSLIKQKLCVRQQYYISAQLKFKRAPLKRAAQVYDHFSRLNCQQLAAYGNFQDYVLANGRWNLGVDDPPIWVLQWIKEIIQDASR
ncbi:hypothetical protein M5K25_021173 [Dendrobium thyrsiflorum]|uniref:Uncharacterized protein n=1 Tax=Dendrobium thyrsiflorum TaxID=117978 RepID=A0ABD0UCF6_DENTH